MYLKLGVVNEVNNSNDSLKDSWLDSTVRATADSGAELAGDPKRKG